MEKLDKHEKELLEKKPKSADDFFRRGTIYRKLEQFNKALNDFHTAIKLSPNNTNKAKYYSECGCYYVQISEAETKYRSEILHNMGKAIELDPNNAQYYSSRSRYCGAIADYKTALEDINKAINLEPTNYQHVQHRGYINKKLEKENAATLDYQKAKELEEYSNTTTSIKSDIEYFKKRIKDIRHIQDFHKILEALQAEHKKEKIIWLIASGIMIFITIILIADLEISPSSIFLSVVTFIVIRQYTNAKQLSIETENRLAMAKMFEKVRQEDNESYKKFLPNLINSIAYSMYQKKQNENYIIESLLEYFKKK